MDAIFQNITAILGFGFLGLSAIFVILAYSNVQQVTAQENPNQSKVSLSKFFMTTALVFMVFSGPLQWASIYIESTLGEKEVKIHITMTHPEWEETFGEVLLVEKGEAIPLVNKPYTGTFGDDDEIQINASKVASAIRKIRAQLTATTSTLPPARRTLPSDPEVPAPNLITRGVLEGG